MPDGESERTTDECLDCSNAYAVKEWPDGAIQPIGIRNGYQCGYSASTFEALAELITLRKTR